MDNDMLAVLKQDLGNQKQLYLAVNIGETGV